MSNAHCKTLAIELRVVSKTYLYFPNHGQFQPVKVRLVHGVTPF